MFCFMYYNIFLLTLKNIKQKYLSVVHLQLVSARNGIINRELHHEKKPAHPEKHP